MTSRQTWAEASFEWRVFLLLPGRAATVLASRRCSDLSLQGFDRDRVSGQQAVIETPIIWSADLQIPRVSASSRSDKTLPGRILPSTNLHLLKQFLYRFWLSNPESTHPGSPRPLLSRTCIRIISIRGLVESCRTCGNRQWGPDEEPGLAPSMEGGAGIKTEISVGTLPTPLHAPIGVKRSEEARNGAGRFS